MYQDLTLITSAVGICGSCNFQVSEIKEMNPEYMLFLLKDVLQGIIMYQDITLITSAMGICDSWNFQVSENKTSETRVKTVFK